MSSQWGRRTASQTESFLSTFGFCYTFIGLYFTINVILFLNEAVSEANRHDDFQKYVTAVARGSGAIINFNLGITLLMASRSFIGFVRETPLSLVLPIDKAMPDFHQVVGDLVLYAGVLHSIMHWVTYIIKRPWSGGLSGLTSLFVTGMILLVLFIAVRVVARPVVYQANYELFHRVHVGGGVLAFIVVLMHGFHHGQPNTWKWVIGPVIIYILDVAFRSFREHKSYLLVSKHSAVFQSQNILKIRLPRVFHFQAGQYAELKVPALSLFQWHPFTIASAPHESEMIFYVKAVGNWTQALYQLFRERITGNGDDIEIHIRGPFGAPAQHVGQFDHVILIGGGVGATPFCSVVKDAYNWMTNWTPQNKKHMPGSINRNTQKPSAEHYERHAKRAERDPTSRVERRVEHTRRHSSHLFTTNVYTEDFNTVELNAITQQKRLSSISRSNTYGQDSTASQGWRDVIGTSVRNNTGHDDDSTTTAFGRSLWTARDFLSTSETTSWDSQSPSSSSSSPQLLQASTHGQLPIAPDKAYVPQQKTATKASTKEVTRRKFNSAFTPMTGILGNDEMGSYRENSTGINRSSVDYMDALFSAYSNHESNQVFQKSLDMMVSLSFGSASLVRTVRMRQAQRAMQEASSSKLPVTTKEDLSVFYNPRVMFLLYMRSVTVNMVLLWLLLLRVSMIGIAHVFGGLSVFTDGLALYKSPVLTTVDFILALLITLLVGIPAILEVVILGAAPIHGLDLFVLLPITLFDDITHILALAKVGQDVQLFGVINLFVIWPLLGVLIMIRLLRVIGERIAQAENLVHTHSSTKRVDFYWTAPYPDDDHWLVGELSPYSNLRAVQLHRYLTRCDEDTSNVNIDPNATYLFTNFGRPNWEELLNETAEKCHNNTTIGVFFCGPYSMGAAVQEACTSAMRNSIIRGLHSGARAMRGLEEVFGQAISANEYTGETVDGKSPGARGCNIRFIFKRETFA